MFGLFGPKKEAHKLTIEHSMWSDEFRNALYATNSPVTSHQYVIEEDGKKTILYDVTIIGDSETWDALNREMGKLGIAPVKKQMTKKNKKTK